MMSRPSAASTVRMCAPSPQAVDSSQMCNGREVREAIEHRRIEDGFTGGDLGFECVFAHGLG